MPIRKTSKKPLFKDVQLHRPKKGLLNYLRWKGFTDDDDALLILTDETGATTGYLEMLTVLGKYLDFVYGKGTDGASQIIQGYNNLLRTFLTDFDVLITQMPADSHIQQRNWALALQEANQALKAYKQHQDTQHYQQTLKRRDYIQKQINLAGFVAKNINHEAYTAFIYGKDIRETIRLRNQFKSSGGSSLTTQPMTREQKKLVLEILSDPTRQLTGQ